MDFESLKKDLDNLDVSIKSSLSPVNIVKIMVEGVSENSSLTLFTNFNNGRIDTLLKIFMDIIKEKLGEISLKHSSEKKYSSENIELIKKNVLNTVNRKLVEIESKTDAADNDNRIYQNVTFKLRNRELSFSELEMDTYVSADLNYRLVDFANQIIFEVNKLSPSIKSSVEAKHFAFLHKLKIEVKQEEPFIMNDNDNYPKKEIEQCAKDVYKLKNVQGFYRAFIDIDLDNKPYIATYFKPGYKKIITDLSNRNDEIIQELKKYPN